MEIWRHCPLEKDGDWDTILIFKAPNTYFQVVFQILPQVINGMLTRSIDCLLQTCAVQSRYQKPHGHLYVDRCGHLHVGIRVANYVHV